MQEYQIIRKIKKLQQIKPRKEWVIFTKRGILGEEVGKIKPGNFSWDWLFKPALKPILIFPILLLLIIGIGLQFSKPQDVQNVSELKKVQPGDQNVQVLVSALEELNTGVSEMIKQFKNAEKPSDEEIVEVGPKLAKSIKSGKLIMNEVKGLDSEKVLGDKVAELGENLGEYENVANSYIEDYVEKELEKLEGLNDKNLLPDSYQEDLKEAREYYKENDYLNTLMKLIEISQKEKETER